MADFIKYSVVFFNKLADGMNAVARKIPVIKNIPAFTTLPDGIHTSNLRFYKLSNLVLTLGWMVHLLWIFFFLTQGRTAMSIINVISVLIYIYSIYINRHGDHFVSSAIMVYEIIIHQIIAIRFFGWDAGFQNYILVISIFPFLMPKGRWYFKTVILVSLLIAYLFLDFYIRPTLPCYEMTSFEFTFLRISNTIFAFISLAVCGAYFNNAMHETEDSLAAKSNELQIEKEKSDALLLNILPEETAIELKEKGSAAPRYFDHATIMFTDFINFTKICEQLKPEELVKEIDYYYKNFDNIISRYNIEKIKTIGDSYMCVGGIPIENDKNQEDVVHAALDIIDFILLEKEKRILEKRMYFEVRCGIHTGAVVAGIVGTKKFAYDIWGDAVNIASRMESNGEANSVNISSSTYELIQHQFNCVHRGKINIKNKGEMDMYLVHRSLRTNS